MNAPLRGDASPSLFYALILATLALGASVAPNMSRAEGYDVLTVNFPADNTFYALAGCFTQYDGNTLLANCQQGIPIMPALVFDIPGTPITFGALTDNSFYWFTEWGNCTLIEAVTYPDYNAYLVQCFADEIFREGF